MNAEFIDKPVSGKFPEVHFGEISPFCLWVKITNNDYEEWVGSFQQGWHEYGTFILTLEKEKKAFIVAGGEGYLIDTDLKKLLNNEKVSGIKSAITNDNQTKIYFSNGYNIQFINLEGELETLFENYYFGDIQLIEILNNKLYAKYWDYQRDKDPFRFEIDLITREVKDTYLDAIENKYSEENPNHSIFKKILKWIWN